MTAAAPSAPTPAARPARKSKVARTLRLASWDAKLGVGRLEVTEGRRADAYGIYRIEPGYCEHAFRLVKLGSEGGSDYHVGVERQGHTCDCMGFEAHGHCRHSAAVLRLLELGKI